MQYHDFIMRGLCKLTFNAVYMFSLFMYLSCCVFVVVGAVGTVGNCDSFSDRSVEGVGNLFITSSPL